MNKPMTAFQRAYLTLMQKTQAGLLFLGRGIPGVFEPDEKMLDPKHLRVGINNQIVEASAVTKLLMDKGVFTREEWEAATVIAYEEEVARLQTELSEKAGRPVTLDVPPGFLGGYENAEA